MKKVVKLISLFILLLIVNVGVVRAANTCGGVTITADTTYDKENGSKLGIYGSDNKQIQFGGLPLFQYRFNIKSFTEAKATSATAYCHNPGIHDYNPTGSTLNCASLLYDESGNNTEYDNMFGAGLMTILDDKNASYVEKYIAENMYEMLFTFKDSKSYDTQQVKYLRYYLAAYYKDYKDELNTLLNSAEYGISDVDLKVKCPGSCNTNDESIKNAIKLLEKGLKAANMFNKGKTPEMPAVSASYTAPTKSSNPSNSEKSYIYIVFPVTVSNFPNYTDSVKPSVKLNFTCDNCKQNGVTIEAQLQKKSLTNAYDSFELNGSNGLSNINILERYKDKINENNANNKSTTIKLRIRLEIDKDKCANLNYALTTNYVYNASQLKNNNDLTPEEQDLVNDVVAALNKTGYEVGECSSREKCQGFYVLQDNASNGNNNSNSGGNGNGNANVEVKNNYNVEKELTVRNTISTCNTGITNPDAEVCPAKISNVSCTACKQSNNTIEIKEGYEYANENVCDTSGAELNIHKCIIDSKDMADNSYKSDDLSNVSQIGGANVYCKEDITLNMPGSRVTEPGTYFSLDPTSITGTKSCYSSEYGDASTLQAKVKTASDQAVYAYNKYLLATAVQDCLNNPNTAKGCTITPGNHEYIPCATQQKTCYNSGATTREKCQGSLGGDGTHNCTKATNARETMWHYDDPYDCTELDGYKAVYKATLTVSADGYSYDCKDGNKLSISFPITHKIDICMAKDAAYAVADTFMKWSPDAAKYLKETIGEDSTLSCSPVDASKPGGAFNCIGSAGTGLTGEVENSSAVIPYEISTWNNSFKWDMSYNFEPTVSFWYQEKLSITNHLMDLTAKTSTTYCNGYESNGKCYSDSSKSKEIGFSDKSVWYCNGTVTDDYSKCNNDSWTNVLPTTPVSYCSCTSSGCTPKTENIYTAKYVKQEQTKTNTYQVPRGFYSAHPSGSILYGKPGLSDQIPNATELDRVLPVALTTIGTQDFVLWVDKLGEFYSSTNNGKTSGRIWGEGNNQGKTILSETLKAQENAKCDIPDVSLVSKYDKNDEINSNGVYVCKYSTDCKNNCQNPKENKVKDENGQDVTYYTYCDYIPKSDNNSSYLCRTLSDKITYDKYIADCFTLETPKCEIVGDKYYGKDGKEITGTEQEKKSNYYQQCTSCSWENGYGPIVEYSSSDKKTYYTYYDKVPLGNDNASYKLKEHVEESEYKADCDPTTKKPSCQRPTETDNNWYCKNGNACDETTFYNECTSCNTDNGKPGPIVEYSSSEKKTYTYCDDIPLGSNNATHQCKVKVPEEQYNIDCPPGPGNNTCKDPTIKTNANNEQRYYYKIGNKQYNDRTKIEYFQDCTSCYKTDGHPGPLELPNGNYSFYNQEYDDGENKVYENVTPEERETYCPNGNGNNNCKNPTIKTDANNKQLYSYKIGDKQYNNRTRTEYLKDCTSCYYDEEKGHPGPLKLPNGKLSFYNQENYDDGTHGPYENKTEAQLKSICCPDCPTEFACTPVSENGKIIYYDNNGEPITGQNEEEIIAKYNKVCGHVCEIVNDANGNKTYYGKNGQKTDEKTYKTQCCPDGNCPTTCEYCLYDGSKLNIQYRPVTSEDLNPNDRELGVNWKWDNNIDTTLELKAFVTTDEIETKGDEIFNLEKVDFDNKTTGDETFAMKVRMTPSLTSRLRSINKDKKFATNTLECYDQKDENDNVIYENVYCYSTVIDDLIKEGYDINFTVERPPHEGRENADHTKYFTSFASKQATAWELRTGMELAIGDNALDKFGIEIDRKTGNMTDYHVGPSWK